MKILQISKSCKGGAGKAAIRLHESLLSKKINSTFLCLEHKNDQVEKVFVPPSPQRYIGFKIAQKLGFPIFRSDWNKRKLRRYEGNYEIFSFPRTEFNLLKSNLIKEADIIHLHWVANFLDWPSFFSKVNKPIVWTLHDMNPFMGGFHYRGDLERNQNEFKRIELENHLIKEKAIREANNLTIVPLSNWLKKSSLSSDILGRFPHTIIPNGLNTQKFQSFDKQFSRQVFGLPANKKVILFVAERVSNYRKGFDILINALSSIDKKELSLAIIGKVKKQEIDKLEGLNFLGFISDERLLTLAYSAADLFVIPSREDNLPNTVMESLACGTPVVGFNIGGIPDMVKPPMNGVLVDELSETALAKGIQQALSMDFDRARIREDAVQRFDQSVQASRYIELYKSLIS